ncbi:MAG TPA: restriction endonuclease subunit S, partial [Aeromonadales bacterium]|nr:restriction endonuclease subunit S [Aeromonadales bacterium]
MNWPLVLLSDLCDINIGKTPSRSNLSYWGKGQPWLSIADMNQGKYLYKTKEEITEIGIKDCNCKIVKKGTLLYSFKLSVGKVGIAERDIYTNEAIAAFPIKDQTKVIGDYLYYALKKIDILGKTDRAVMGAILNKKKLSELKIPLPPLKEQKRIASILDKADNLRRKRAQAIQLADKFLRAVFLDMFGDPVTNPKGLKIYKLKELCNKITDGTHHSPPITKDGVPYITAKHLKETGLEFFNNPWYISESSHKKIYSR